MVFMTLNRQRDDQKIRAKKFYLIFLLQIQNLITNSKKMQSNLQRPTDQLHFSDTRQQIEQLFQVAFLIDKGQFSQASKKIQSLLLSRNQNMANKKYDPMGLELKYNKILTQLYQQRDDRDEFQSVTENCIKQFQSLLQNISDQYQHYFDQEQEQQWEYAENLRLRIYTTVLQLSIKSQEVDLQLWLQCIIDQLKLYPQHLPEVLGKLSGCKNLEQFCQNFNSDHILVSQLMDLAKKASLIQLASNWFILGGLFQKGLKLKELALRLWKESNRRKEFQKCQVQFMELQSHEGSQYCMRLRKLARITTKLLKELLNSKKEPNKYQNIGLIVKKGMHSSLQQINSFNQHLDAVQEQMQKTTMKKSFWSSKKSTLSTTKKSLLKDSKLLQYYQKSHQFYKQTLLKQKNDQITSLLADDSKFILQQKKKLSKFIVPLIQMFTIRRKYAFLTIKHFYIVKYGILKSGFLSSLQIGKDTPQKNKKTVNGSILMSVNNPSGRK